MTYTYKLSRRLARLRAASVAVLAPVLLTLSCTGEQSTGPDTPAVDPQGVSVAPGSVYMAPHQEMQFQASLTNPDSYFLQGTSNKGRARGRRSVTAVTISPSTIAVGEGLTTSFAATALLSDGSTTEPTVTWTATGGVIDANGRYAAGQVPGSYTVSATAGNGVGGTASVTVTDNPPLIADVSLSPTNVLLPVGGSKRFLAVGTSNNGLVVALSAKYMASGGTISADGLYQAGQTPGNYQVIATDTVMGLADTSAVTIEPSAPTLQAVLLSPQTVSLVPSANQQFSASAQMSDGSVSSLSPVWTASGGTISAGGLYTAGQTAGTFQVIATDTSTDLADTSVVIIQAPPQAPPPILQSVVVTPATVSLTAGAVQQFTASGRMSDGSTTAITVAWAASGGTIAGGLYTAGQTGGTYRVIATQSGGTLADTATVTITAPAPTPVPSTGKTFFVADAESGVVSPPWNGPVFAKYGVVPATSSAEAKDGTRSYKFEIPPTSVISSSTVMAVTPQASMGGPSGRFMSGYYSFWAYVDAGFNNNAWNMILGWMTGVSGAPSPISYIGLENWTNNGASRGGTTLQLVFLLKNCSAGQYTCPSIPGYAQSGGWYRQTSASPNGVTPFPRNQWVHLSVYYKMAPTNGQVTIWQNGVKVMDLTAPTLNTFVGHTTQTNTSGDMVLQHFIYGGAENTTRRLYVDDFKVTDYRVLP